MRVSIIVLGLVAILSLAGGCGGPRTTVVLVPDYEGQVGQVEVATDAGVQVLRQAGEAAVVSSRDKLPVVEFFDAHRIESVFGAALQAEPPQPEIYIIYFETNSVHPLETSHATIRQIVEAILSRNSRDVSIVGHSDRSGLPEHNLQLSLERAQNILEILKNAGIEELIVEISSHGENRPLIPTPPGVAEARNRRVEVIVR